MSVQATLDFGRRALDRGDLDHARAAFAAVLSLDADSREARSSLLHVLRRSGRFDEGEERFRSFLRSAPDHETLAEGIQLLIDGRKFADARSMMAALRGGISDTLRLQEMRVMLEFSVGDPLAASSLARDLLASGTALPGHVLEAVLIVSMLSGHFGDARGLLDGSEGDGHWRTRLERTEMNWSVARTRFDDATEMSPGVLRRLADRSFEEGDLGCCGALVQMVFAHPQASSGDYEWVSDTAFALSGRGEVDSTELITRALGCALFRTVPTSGARFKYAQHLMQKQAFHDASALFLEILQSERNDDRCDEILRMLAVCRAAGALTDRRFEDAVTTTHLGLLKSGYIGRFVGDGHRRVADEGGMPHKHISRALVRSVHRRPRIAVCIFGQLRGFRSAWARTREALSDLDTTVFVSTWAKIGGGIGSQNMLDRVLPPGLADGLPSHLRTVGFVARRFPQLFDLTTRPATETAEGLKLFFETEHAIVLEEDAFDSRLRTTPGLLVGGSGSQAKMYYTMHSTLRQKAEHEERHGLIFDGVIRLRADRGIEHLCGHEMSRAIASDIYLTDHFYSWAIGDQASLSSSLVADEIAGIWPMILQHGGFGGFPSATGRAAEWLMGEYLVDRRVAVGGLKTTRFTPLLSPTLSMQAVVAALLSDLEGKDQLDSDDSAMIRGVSALSAAADRTPAWDHLVGRIPGLP